MFKAFLISIGTIILGVIVVIVSGLGSVFKVVGKVLKAIFKRRTKTDSDTIINTKIEEKKELKVEDNNKTTEK